MDPGGLTPEPVIFPWKMSEVKPLSSEDEKIRLAFFTKTYVDLQHFMEKKKNWKHSTEVVEK